MLGLLGLLTTRNLCFSKQIFVPEDEKRGFATSFDTVYHGPKLFFLEEFVGEGGDNK